MTASKPACSGCGSTTRKLTGVRVLRCASCARAFRNAQKARAHENRVQKVYGLGEGEYARLYDFQGGRCYICRRARGVSKRLAVDHDHVSGKVRGLLCKACNHDVLGHARDSIEFFERAIDYLKNPPYDRMVS